MDPAPEPEPPEGSPDSRVGRSRLVAGDGTVYSAAFWIAYVANTAVVAANALTFRFAELVDALGGRERTAGLIVSVAIAGALVSRLYLGQALDRYGVRRCWIFSALLFVAGGAGLTAADSLSWVLYAARSLFAVGLAGMFTCSTVHIQNLVPPHRRTEVIGSLGSSGFVGMIAGSILGDAIFRALDGSFRFTVLFGTSTLLGALYVALVLFLTRRDRHDRPAATPAFHRLAVRYWPGNVMLVALAMGMVFAVTTVFLTRFATHRQLSGIGPFFAAYAGSAFTFRMVARGWSRTVGRHRMILLGLAGHVVALASLPFVTSEWLFAAPALFGGFGHALLFPAVVSLGSEAFPPQYRGTGTTLVMGFFDVGTFISAPILGGIIDAFDRTGFTPMFLFAASIALAVGVTYLFTTARTPDSDLLSQLSVAEDFVPQPLTREESGSQPSAPELSSAQLSARERSVSEPSAHEVSRPDRSVSQPFAREGFADEISAREGIAAPDRHSDKPSDRAAVSVPATRCR